jgi:hypothetical protein
MLATKVAAPSREALAAAYHTAPHHQLNKAELEQWHRWVRARALEESQGLSVVMVDSSPYEYFDQMKAEVERHRYLQVSTLNNTDPLLPGLLNLQYRVLHDLWHVRLDADFSWEGELKVARHGLAETWDQPLIQKILFSEMVLQTAHALEYGYFREDQPYVPVPRTFIEQLLEGALV